MTDNLLPAWLSTIAARLRAVGWLVGQAWKRFFAHGGLNLAAAVAFYAILSLIPFFFIVVSLAGRILGHSSGFNEVIRAYLDKVIPYYSEVLMTEVSKISLGSGYHGWLGLVFMVWIGSLVFDSLDYALNQAFESPSRRSYLRTKLMSLSVFPAAGFFLILSLFLSGVVSGAGRLHLEQYIPGLNAVQQLVVENIAAALPYLMLMAVIVLLFRLVPSVDVTFPQAAAGAVLCTAGWMVEKWIFGLIILPNPNYGLVYGSLKALIILILWIFFAMCLVLFSAEVLAEYRLMIEKNSKKDEPVSQESLS